MKRMEERKECDSVQCGGGGGFLSIACCPCSESMGKKKASMEKPSVASDKPSYNSTDKRQHPEFAVCDIGVDLSPSTGCGCTVT